MESRCYVSYNIISRQCRMNGYIINSTINESQKINYMSLFLIIVPLLAGVVIDIIFTQIMGSQYCNFNKTTYTCIIHKLHVQEWVREIVRISLQLSLILCAFTILERNNFSVINSMYTSFFGIIGLILFFIVQPDLFSDFRRFFNGLLFSLKHN